MVLKALETIDPLDALEDDQRESVNVELASMGALLRTNNINEAYGLAMQNGGRVKPRQRRMSLPYGTSAGLAADVTKAVRPFAATAVPEDSLQNVKLLGEGTYAKVYKAKYKTADGTMQIVAVKRLRPDALLSKTDRDLFIAEGKLLQRLRHKHIVGFLGMGRVEAAGKRAAGMFIVQEYVKGGTLGRMVHQQMLASGTYTVADGVRWMLGVASGLECLHAEGVIHRDLKLDNILLTGKDPKTAVAKITDLGLHTQFATPSSLRNAAATIPTIKQRRNSLLSPSELLPENDLLTPRHGDQPNGGAIGVGNGGKESPFNAAVWRPLGGSDGQAGRMLSGRTGSLMYMAPEVFKCEHYTHKADIFSFGAMLHEVVMGYLNIYRLPQLNSTDDLEVYATKVSNGFRQDVPSYVPKLLAALIADCWNQDPSERPEASEIRERLQQVLDTYGEKMSKKQSATAATPQCGCCVIS